LEDHILVQFSTASVSTASDEEFKAEKKKISEAHAWSSTNHSRNGGAKRTRLGKIKTQEGIIFDSSSSDGDASDNEAKMSSRESISSSSASIGTKTTKAMPKTTLDHKVENLEAYIDSDEVNASLYKFDQVNQFINDGRLKGKLVYTLWKEVDESGKEIDDEFVWYLGWVKTFNNPAVTIGGVKCNYDIKYFDDNLVYSKRLSQRGYCRRNKLSAPSYLKKEDVFVVVEEGIPTTRKKRRVGTSPRAFIPESGL